MARPNEPGRDHAREASQDCESGPGAGDAGVPGRHPLSGAGSRLLSVVDEALIGFQSADLTMA